MSVLQSIINTIADIVFPARCIGCSTIGNHLCDPCIVTIPVRTYEEPHGSAMIDRLFVAGYADDPLLSKAIHALKYQGVSGIAYPLIKYLVTALRQNPNSQSLFSHHPFIIPVPLHAKRLTERGFNQSELLARHLASFLRMTARDDILLRTRHTASQVKTHSRSERLTNMHDAFRVVHVESIQDFPIVLIDDVCTTGATLDSCARALKSAGARSVSAIVLARG